MTAHTAGTIQDSTMSSRRRSGLFRHRQSWFFLVRLLPSSIGLPLFLVVALTKVTVEREPWHGPSRQ
ncbi:hypothetical protein [Streptomyces tailanensis]|uniref:hypothetical protein n=1 Tax=Streptomyces tailanensis TaxID=2569858 RepID=UPI001FED14B7|nr:hypothetical protein [Streptomyces tailanensis]